MTTVFVIEHPLPQRVSKEDISARVRYFCGWKPEAALILTPDDEFRFYCDVQA